jgi:hypothetical protein
MMRNYVYENPVLKKVTEPSGMNLIDVENKYRLDSRCKPIELVAMRNIES